jgi:inorganic pyrophosphatase
MAGLYDLPPRAPGGGFLVVVESPRGAAVKLKYDPELGALTLSRPLAAGLVYPYDWGFIPGTRAPDGDPLDAMVYLDAPTWPGVVIPCRALGVVQVEQDTKQERVRERNDRIIMVPLKWPRLDAVKSCADLPERVRDEIAQFFLSAVMFAGKNAEVLGWGGPETAERIIEQAIRH